MCNVWSTSQRHFAAHFLHMSYCCQVYMSTQYTENAEIALLHLSLQPKQQQLGQFAALKLRG